MNKTKAVMLTAVLIVLLVFVLWMGNQTRAARNTASEYFRSLARDEIPQGISGSVLRLAENLVEYGEFTYTVGKVRLTPSLQARAKIILDDGDEAVEITLLLKRSKGQWQPTSVAESGLAVNTSNQQPRLVLKIGELSLAQELQALGGDKLLTLQPQRAEWLNQGWMELAPYFAAFDQDRPTNLIVGMTGLELYGHGSGLAAAVITERYSPDLIRVNLSTTGHDGIRHSSVQIRGNTQWQVTEAVTGRSISLAPGTVNLHANGGAIVMNSLEFGNRLIFTPANPDSQLQLLSITRSGSHPSYYGSLEVANLDGELIVVNEVPLEQYLRYVVPSEMPASFGVGALEVQAIVARTYALRNLYASEWRGTSAHVVDSVLSQVYNNAGTNSAATAAVEATRGEYVSFDGSPADVRYYSTSSGYTANSHEVWPDSQGNFPGSPVPWLVSRRQYPGDTKDISGEEAYADFILNPPAAAYDARSAWFRWHVTVPAGQMEGIIRDNLKLIFASSPTVITVKDESGEFRPIQEMPEDPLGDLLDLVPARRGEGGVLMAVDVVGSKGTWRVQREYYIRHVLRPQGSSEHPLVLVRGDGSRLKNFSLLPSAYVVWELERTDQGLESITFHGGGFGHGVGMSQFGVRELVALGWTRDQIIQQYFPGSAISQVYSD